MDENLKIQMRHFEQFSNNMKKSRMKMIMLQALVKRGSVNPNFSFLYFFCCIHIFLAKRPSTRSSECCKFY